MPSYDESTRENQMCDLMDPIERGKPYVSPGGPKSGLALTGKPYVSPGGPKSGLALTGLLSYCGES
jgi:hypothetical protein